MPAVPLFPEAGGRWPVATIRDTGIGIPQADQKRLFAQPCRASDAVRQAIPGAGVGLTIVRASVASRHVTMNLRSREGEGTTLVIRLPLHDAA